MVEPLGRGAFCLESGVRGSLHTGRKILGAVSGYAFTFNDPTNTTCCVLV